ncbi:aminoglycoside phosphotransferase family protein [Actinomadura keratinilytica]
MGLPERVVRPPGTGQPGLWQRAVDVIAGPPPSYRGCFLHRDFHPGNVLFTGTGAGLRVSGVVDWVETSWGPADLDVAHCSTALALLHGVPAGMRFADRYVAAGEPWRGTKAPISTGGCWTRSATPRTRRRWRFPGGSWAGPT